MTLKNLENSQKKPLKNPEKSLWSFSGHPVVISIRFKISSYIKL